MRWPVSALPRYEVNSLFGLNRLARSLVQNSSRDLPPNLSLTQRPHEPTNPTDSGHAVATGSGYHAQGILLCKVLFLMSFFWIRVFLFIRHSRDFWTDAKALVRDPKSKYYDRFRACVFMAVNLLLIALQLYWGWALLLAAKKTALGE